MLLYETASVKCINYEKLNLFPRAETFLLTGEIIFIGHDNI